MKNQELRSFSTSVEIRDGTGGRSITGYPIVFNKPSQDLGGFIEYIDSHALDSVDLSNVYLVRSHEFDNVLARVDSGTLSLRIDKTGLNFDTAPLPETTLANDTLADIRFGNIKGMSFQFAVKRDEWNADRTVRTILEIDWISEITLTPVPAYQDTTVAIAKRDSLMKNTYNYKDRLRDGLLLAQIRKDIDGRY